MGEQKQPKKFGGLQTKKLIPVLKKFNAMAEIFLRTLGERMSRKEAQLNKISIMVKDIKIPEKSFNIQIETVDMHTTTVRKKGDYSYNQKMDWEKDFRSPKKGIVL